MRIALFSDVHGNRFALEAVLRDLEAAKPDTVANLGDQVWGAADPAGAWKLQQGLGAVTVRGNTDEFLTYPEGVRKAHTGFAGNLDEKLALAAWLREQLGPGVPEALKALPTVAELAEGAVLIAHGSLRSPHEALFPAGEGNLPVGRVSGEMLEQVAAYPKARVVVVGHTHSELVVAEGGVSFVNAGPVSRPRDGDPAARWVLLEERQGSFSVSFRRVPYDFEAAARWALEHSPIGEQEAQQLRTARFPR
ncbi:metallophosphoesterase family protein [Calidithermus chliarophilus]|uniref:metallophosphoesterase family protein n=1 Tax=Calidithermus chliarophilus TaxID=52023 RepID=UPI0004077208|nr:metallophosphoesterase family protein [Calidithermus chliarophilus]